MLTEGINFWHAFRIPGVLGYSFSYFFIKFSSYGLMFWLPMYLQKTNSYTDYEIATAVSCLDIGYLIGGVLIGYISDLMYCRRTPIAVLAIFLGTILHVLLIIVDPSQRLVFYSFIFTLGIMMGGVTAIVSGISCADLVRLIILTFRAN